MTNAEILLELDEIMAQLRAEDTSYVIMERLAAIKLAISRKPADPPSPLSGGGPGPK